MCDADARLRLKGRPLTSATAAAQQSRPAHSAAAARRPDPHLSGPSEALTARCGRPAGRHGASATRPPEELPTGDAERRCMARGPLHGVRMPRWQEGGAGPGVPKTRPVCLPNSPGSGRSFFSQLGVKHSGPSSPGHVISTRRRVWAEHRLPEQAFGESAGSSGAQTRA